MEIVLGVLMLAVSIALLRYARPDAQGVSRAFMSRAGAGETVAVLFTALVALGLVMVASGVIAMVD